MTRVLGDLAQDDGAVDGRKYVVSSPRGSTARSSRAPPTWTSRTEHDRGLGQSGEIWNVDSEQRYGSTKTVTDVEKMLEEFRRADCVIQAVDIGGLREPAATEARGAGGKDSLFRSPRAPAASCTRTPTTSPPPWGRCWSAPASPTSSPSSPRRSSATAPTTSLAWS